MRSHVFEENESFVMLSRKSFDNSQRRHEWIIARSRATGVQFYRTEFAFTSDSSIIIKPCEAKGYFLPLSLLRVTTLLCFSHANEFLFHEIKYANVAFDRNPYQSI